MESEGNITPERSTRELITDKIEGARKVFDAAKLRSVLLGQKNKGTEHHHQSAIDNSREHLQLVENETPFTKTQDFFKRDENDKTGGRVTPSRVLNIFLNVDGEIRRQSMMIKNE